MPTPYNEATVHNSLWCTEQADLFPSGKVFVHGGIWEAEVDQRVLPGKWGKVVEVVRTLNIKVTRG